MTDRTLFISAYFAHGHYTELGGRSEHLARSKYLPSLKSLKKMNVPFVVWYDEDHADDRALLAKVLSPTDVLLPYNFYTSPLFDIIEEIKINNDISSYQNQRSYHFCLNKLLLIEKTLQQFPDYEYYWWIDAGLSYECLFPHCYLPYIRHDFHWQQYAECTVYSEKIVKNLNRQCGDRVSFFCINRCEYPWLGEQEGFMSYTQANQNLIGGLFGGTRSAFLSLMRNINSFVLTMLHQGLLAYEEPYLTLYWLRNPELFNIYFFDTWYSNDHTFAHDEHGNPPPGKAFFHWLEELAEIPPTPYRSISHE